MNSNRIQFSYCVLTLKIKVLLLEIFGPHNADILSIHFVKDKLTILAKSISLLSDVAYK